MSRGLEETGRVTCECGRQVVLFGRTVSVYCGSCRAWFDHREEVGK